MKKFALVLATAFVCTYAILAATQAAAANNSCLSVCFIACSLERVGSVRAQAHDVLQE